MMAPAALQPVLLLRCPAFRVSALLSLVALRRAVRGQSASADVAPLSVQGLSFALSCHVSAWYPRVSFARGEPRRRGLSKHSPFDRLEAWRPMQL